MQQEDLLSRLRAFAVRSRSATVDLGAFARALPPGTAKPGDIDALVRDLAVKGTFSVAAKDDRVISITFPELPLMALGEEYRLVAQDAGRAFPGDGRLPVPIPDADIVTVDARTALGQVLEPGAKGPPAIRLTFPENVPAVIVPRARLVPDLVEAALDRIGRYLQIPRNADYAGARIRAALGAAETLARQALDDLAVRPRKAASNVISPTEFNVRFWSHLANVISAETGAKTDRTAADQALLQSAFYVSAVAFHRKVAADRAQERAADLKLLEAQVRKAPFVFTLEDLYAMKDEKGSLLTAKHGREFITSFLAARSSPGETRPPGAGEPGASELLPFLVQCGSFFIQRDLIAPVFLNRLGEAAESLHAAYVKEWVARMREDEAPPAARIDAPFRADVYRRVGDAFPVLAALANGPVLAIASRNPALPDAAREDLLRCFESEGVLRPFPALLGLSRVGLLKEARSFLPFWLTAPIISGVVRFFRALLRRGLAPAQPAPAAHAPGPVRIPAEEGRAAADRLAVERMHRAVQAIIARYVPAGASVDSALEELVERWNPLLEPGPKKDLVRDVNALVLDFLRPIRSSFLMRPPDVERVTALAEQLAASRSLAIIRNRDPLLRYISLVMLRNLLLHKP
jgi:hypothetical protein